MATGIDMTAAAAVETVQPWPLGETESHDTTHYSVMDSHGHAGPFFRQQLGGQGHRYPA